MLNHRSAPAAALRLCVSTHSQLCQFLSTPRRVAVCLFVALLAVYLAWPTRNHYWDGIGFALNIEGFAQNHSGLSLSLHNPDGSHIYFNPNHLLHNLFGYLLYSPVHALFPGVRALELLVVVNSLCSAGVAVLVFRMLARWTGDLQLSVWVTMLMAFSGTWWKFSTDANAYVPSTFLLVCCAYLLTLPGRPPVVAIGLLHAAAICTHQIAVLFYPAVVVALWPQRREIVRYSAASALPVLGAYLAVWFAENPAWSTQGFVQWVTYNGADVYAHRGPVTSFAVSVGSLAKVFFGGRPALAVRVAPWPMLAFGVVVILAALVRLFVPTASAAEVRCGRLPGLALLTAWAGSFQLFLFFWLTEYPYYRLFAMPAFFLALGVFAGGRPQWRRRIPAALVVVAVFNFTFMIYPYSQPESTPPVHLANHAQSVWTGQPMVLYKDATCDNWFMRYFNPHTQWTHVSGRDMADLSQQIQRALEKGRAVWLDTTLLGHLENDPELESWLASHGELGEPWGISNGRYHIRFAELRPRETSQIPVAR